MVRTSSGRIQRWKLSMTQWSAIHGGTRSGWKRMATTVWRRPFGFAVGSSHSSTRSGMRS